MINRRHLLGSLSLGATALAFHELLVPALAQAGDPSTAPLLVFAYFQGGWDQLLVADPRDNEKYKDENGGVYPGYQLHADLEVKTALSQNPGGVISVPGNNLTLGPACSKLAKTHGSKLCAVRGIDMGTLTHEVGMRHFLTGKVPRGLTASGSSLPTAWVHDVGPYSAIPNLVIGMETYNEDMATAASGLRLGSARDLSRVLTALDPELRLDAASRSAVDAYLANTRCSDQAFDRDGLVSQYLASRPTAAKLSSGELQAHFDLYKSTNQLSAELQELVQAFGITKTSDIDGANGQAAIAAQALVTGVSQAVSVQLANNIDDHDDTYPDTHAGKVRQGLDALSDLISFLEKKNVWNRTVVIAWSEFARTPRLNGRSGRDHHLASSCLVAGKGIRGNIAIGGTNDTNFGVVGCDLSSGKPLAEGGAMLQPCDVHATVLKALGLGYEHLSNQNPEIIAAMLA